MPRMSTSSDSNTNDSTSPQTSQEKLKQREDEREHEEVLEKAAASAHIVYRAILKEAEEELERPSIALAWSGFAAGLSMGFSLVTQGLLQSRLPDTPWRELVGTFGYTVGFIILILGRQQLFTENTLTPILSLLKRRDRDTFVNVARLWGVLLLTNLLGAALFAYTLERTQIFGEREKAMFLKISSEAMEPSRWLLFGRAIFAGWLIATMVWMLPVAETSRIWVLVLIPYIVGLGRLSHIVIGSIYSIYTIAAHQHTWTEYLTHFAWPVLLGNCIGGVTLVAVINYAQATAGSKDRGGSAPARMD